MIIKNHICKAVTFIKSTFYVVFVAFCSGAYGVEVEEVSQDLLLNDLLQELAQVTAVATRTKLNVDYVPGMVTVLHGADLQKQGILTLSEALQTVPGVEITISNEGQNDFVMRGIGKSFSSGKIKMLINGRAMNAAMSAASTVTTIPLQLVDRIEIIRGPGSAIYGEYAFAGVVNVIIRKDTQLFYTASHHNKHTVGGSWSNFQKDEAIKYALNFSALDNKGKQVTAGSDYLRDLNTGEATDPYFHSISNSPGYSNEAERTFTSGLQLSYKDYQWDTFVQHQEIGDSFGFQNALPPEVTPIRKVITALSDVDKKFKINETLAGVASAGGRYYALRGKLHHFYPDGFPDLVNGGFFDDGVLASPNYTEYEVHGGLEFDFTGVKNHDFLFGLHGVYIKQGDTWARRNWEIVEVGGVDLLTVVPLDDYRGSGNWLTEGNTRKVASIYAQDQWNVIKPLTITIGARYDDYIGIGSSFNPRFAAVYNFLENHIFKIQYSEAFRPPTFFEMYIRNNNVANGNPDISPEIIRSIEAGYIYNNASRSANFRMTTFYSHMHELIVTGESSGKYENKEEVLSRGIEIEVNKKIENKFSFSVNGTFLNIKDEAGGDELPKIANIYGNANISYKPLERITLAFSDQYIGKRKREQGDVRSSIEAYHIFNATFSMDHVLVKEAVVNIGLKNIFNQLVLHPAPLSPFGLIEVPSYAGDYPRPGRELWLNIAYKY